MTASERDSGGPADSGPRPRRRWVRLVPLAAFAVLVAIFLVQLWRGGDPSIVPSALIGRPAPEIALAPLEGLVENGEPLPGFDTADLIGEVTLVNVWGSWCPPCRAEHPYLMELAGGDAGLRMVGINYKDSVDNALRFLDTYGNPFDAVGTDQPGRASIDWGVYGAPETFLVGRDGVIRYKLVGPVTADILAEELTPRIEALLAEPVPPDGATAR